MKHACIVGIVLLILLIGPLGSAAAQSQPPAQTTYIVQPGDNLFRIALRYGTTVDALKAANGLTGNTIYVGQTLVIPGQTAPAPTQPLPQGDAGTSYYSVQSGDNLYRIALRYGTTVDALARANNIVNPSLIQVGQTLIIPGQAAITAAVAPAPVAPASTLSPGIILNKPREGASVQSPLKVRGESLTPGGQVIIELRSSDGVALAREVASGGSTDWAAFSKDVDFSVKERTPAVLRVYADDAQTGGATSQISLSLTLEPDIPVQEGVDQYTAFEAFDAQLVGDAAGKPTAAPIWTNFSYQDFELADLGDECVAHNFTLLYRFDRRWVYFLPSQIEKRDDEECLSTWRVHSVPEIPGYADNRDLTAPEGYLVPAWAIGKVWRKYYYNPDLGNTFAKTGEVAFTGALQTFEYGLMIYDPDLKRVYLLLNE
jgi:LysM repeat protein